MHDVVVAGAGPNGLMLACELALGGVRPLVLDARSRPSTERKANGLVGQVVRTLDMRGLYHEFGGPPGAPRPVPGGVFAGMALDYREVADNPMYFLPMQQPRLVRLLERRARGLGVAIGWGHEVIGLVQHDAGVSVAVRGPDGSYELGTRYLVGADGAHSLVRKSAGIDFPGSTTDVVVRIADVHIPDELRAANDAVGIFGFGARSIEVPGLGRLPSGHHRFASGVFILLVDVEPGRTLLATMEFGGEPVPDDTPMTLPEFQASLRRVLGTDLPVEPLRLPNPLRRMNGLNSRQADRYRAGNVFLVGDSAHVHSALGGPGLNLGLQDAVNLGWKLAAAVRGYAPGDLLDSYHSERYPVGLRVQLHSVAQLALMTPGPEVTALRSLLEELLMRPGNAAYLAHLLAGSDVRYDVGDPHRWSGRLVPELIVDSGRQTVRVAELMRPARPVLLDFSGGRFAEVARGWEDRVDGRIATCPDADVAAVLIRPDGYLAWAADQAELADSDRLRAAITRWFGMSTVSQNSTAK